MTPQVNDRPFIARVAEFMRGLLAEPSTAGLDPDSLDVTLRRRELIQSRAFLRRLYQEWYAQIAGAIPQTSGAILEIGSGGGFMSSAIPEVITSDVLPLPGVDVVLNAERLPFADGSLRAVVMTNVLHHIPDVARFLGEFTRCTRAGGALVIIEPWVTGWSRRVYGTLHSEPFDPAAKMWTLISGRPLSEANGALPWIVFERDRRRFSEEFPELSVETIRPLMPLRYLVSGGVSMRSLVPGWSFRFWKGIDDLLTRVSPETAMFALIVVRRA
jgi:SAM-dependent methyltransferase